jgi:hypothetical protein
VTATDSLGVSVPVSAAFVLEPGTGAVLLLGLAAILAQAAHRSRSFFKLY